MVAAPDAPEGPPRILVVEDEAELRSLWVDVLKDAGCAPTAVADGAEAWKLLPDLEPDLILLDLVMPDAKLDGFGLLARLNQSRTPIVVISALAEVLGETLRDRVSAVLPKPVQIDHLVREVFRLLGRTPPDGG